MQFGTCTFSIAVSDVPPVCQTSKSSHVFFFSEFVLISDFVHWVMKNFLSNEMAGKVITTHPTGKTKEYQNQNPCCSTALQSQSLSAD